MPNVDWNQEEVGDGRSFETLPKGRYPCQIEGIESKETKSRDGSYYETTFIIAKGEYKGRKLWDRLNVHNKSEVAQQIGREKFKSLCKAALGKDGVKKTEELHNKYVVCLVDIERGGEGRPDQNRIGGYMSAADFKAAAAPAASPTKAAAGEEDDIPFIINECYFEVENRLARRLRRK